MKLTYVFMALAVFLMVGQTQAAPYTMDFANTTLDLGLDEYTDLTTQYSSFGLTFSSIYRYQGKLDPYDEFAISTSELSKDFIPVITDPDPVKDPPPPPPDPVILFSNLTDFVEFEYFTTYGDMNIEIMARDMSDNIIGSFVGTGVGTGRIDALGIRSLVFNQTSYAGISTLMYDRPASAAIPEPSTFILIGLGLIGLKLRRNCK